MPFIVSQQAKNQIALQFCRLQTAEKFCGRVRFKSENLQLFITISIENKRFKLKLFQKVKIKHFLLK